MEGEKGSCCGCEEIGVPNQGAGDRREVQASDRAMPGPGAGYERGSYEWRKIVRGGSSRNSMGAVPTAPCQVLWPECGWQPVSLTDLITGASVKRFIGKQPCASIMIRCNKKGATLQQKYIAEKVFDLLKQFRIHTSPKE